ncbi:MAG: hypothetical protein ABH810_03465 [bacterium]
MKQRVAIQASLISVVILFLVGCSTSVSYKPPLLPVKFVIDNTGKISVVGEISLVTFIGEFSIGAEYTINSEPDNILVIIRDQSRGSHGLDTIYRVHTNGDELTVVLNGETTVQVANKQVIIDVTNAEVKSIEFKRAEDSGVTSSGFWKTGDDKYRPFKVMQRAIDKDTWLGNIAALLLFPIELIALPLYFYLRSAEILFGEVGWYGAYFLLVIIWLGSMITAGKSDGSKFLAIVLSAIIVCAFIIGLLL